MATGSRNDKVDREIDNPKNHNTISIGGNVAGSVVAGSGNTVGDVVLGDKLVARLGDSVPLDSLPSLHIERSIPVTIYLSDGEAHEEVEEAVTELLSAFEFEVVKALPPIEGSWYRAFVAVLKRAFNSRELADRLKQVERGIELHLMHKTQAEVDSLQADAVAKLLTALEKTPSGLIQIGSVLLIKVDGVPAVRNLTQRELAYLERNPTLLRNPAAIFDALQEATPPAALLES